MENASKALIMAAGILLGVMIISIGVVLYSTFSQFGNETAQKMEDNKIAEWNQNYLKYYGKTIIQDENGKDVITPIPVTAHDIITVTNHARQNNVNYEIQDLKKYDETSYYVQVDVDKEKNFETKTEEEKNEFLRNNSLIHDEEIKYYTCTEVKISSITKKVIYIKFEAQK